MVLVIYCGELFRVSDMPYMVANVATMCSAVGRVCFRALCLQTRAVALVLDIVIRVVITQLTMGCIEFVSVVTWMVGWLVCLHMRVCMDLPMVLVLVILFGVILLVSGMYSVAASAPATCSVVARACL